MNMCENFPLKKSLKQVLVDALRQLDASTIMERALPIFRKDFGYLVKAKWEMDLKWYMRVLVRAISHTRLKAHDHCNVRTLIG